MRTLKRHVYTFFLLLCSVHHLTVSCIISSQVCFFFLTSSLGVSTLYHLYGSWHIWVTKHDTLGLKAPNNEPSAYTNHNSWTIFQPKSKYTDRPHAWHVYGTWFNSDGQCTIDCMHSNIFFFSYSEHIIVPTGASTRSSTGGTHANQQQCHQYLVSTCSWMPKMKDKQYGDPYSGTGDGHHDMEDLVHDRTMSITISPGSYALLS